MDFDGEYSNGADGTCQECGEPTEEEHHLFCEACFAEHNGWHRPDRDELEAQHQEREETSLLRLVERVSRLERLAERLAGLPELVELLASLQERVERLERLGRVQRARTDERDLNMLEGGLGRRAS